MRAGVLSYRLLSFERNASGGFASPHDYPREALAAVSTHDLPTFKGWWRGVDVDLRECFGFFDAPLAETERRLRAQDRLRLMTALAEEGLSAKDADVSEARPPATQVLRFLSRTPCALTAIQIRGRHRRDTTGQPSWPLDGTSQLAAATVAHSGGNYCDHGPAARSAAIVGLEGRGLAPAAVRLAAAPPRATYRLQFNRDFRFEDATKIAPYLRDLGISHVYASPITRAAPGSMHGYDVQDYNEINPGTRRHGGLSRNSRMRCGAWARPDRRFVPNHMGIAGPGNRLVDLGSRMGREISRRRRVRHRLSLPAVARQGSSASARRGLADALQARRHFTPLSAEPRRLRHQVFRPNVSGDAFSLIQRFLPIGAAAREGRRPRRSLGSMFGLPKVSSAGGADSRWRKSEIHPRRGRGKAGAGPRHRSPLSAFDPKTEWGRRALDALLDQQNYRLALWRLASSEINYRRFFDISTLAAVRVEDEKIFARAHDLLFDLVRQGRIQGVRLDHIDGFADPAAYLERLQSSLGPGFYVLVGKIPGIRRRPARLADRREQPATKPSQKSISSSWTRRTPKSSTALYEEATGDFTPYEEQLVAIKSGLLKSSFGGELETLTRDIDAIAKARPFSLDLDKGEIRAALVALISSFPVYRSYIRSEGPKRGQRRSLQGDKPPANRSPQVLIQHLISLSRASEAALVTRFTCAQSGASSS